MLIRTLESPSLRYSSRLGIMKNRESTRIRNPRGATNLFLFSGSESILLMI